MTTSIKLTALAVFTAFAVLLVACGSTQTEDAVAVDAPLPNTTQTEAPVADATTRETEADETDSPETEALPEAVPEPETPAVATTAPPSVTERDTTTTTAPTTTTKREPSPNPETEAGRKEIRRQERIEARAIPLPNIFLGDKVPDGALIQPRPTPLFPILRDGAAPVRSCEVVLAEGYEFPSPIHEVDIEEIEAANSHAEEYIEETPKTAKTIFTNCSDYYSHNAVHPTREDLLESNKRSNAPGLGWSTFGEGHLATLLHGVIKSGDLDKTQWEGKHKRGDSPYSNVAYINRGRAAFRNCFFVYEGQVHLPDYDNNPEYLPLPNLVQEYASTYLEAGGKAEWHCEPNFKGLEGLNCYHPFYESAASRPDDTAPYFEDLLRKRDFKCWLD